MSRSIALHSEEESRSGEEERTTEALSKGCRRVTKAPKAAGVGAKGFEKPRSLLLVAHSPQREDQEAAVERLMQERQGLGRGRPNGSLEVQEILKEVDKALVIDLGDAPHTGYAVAVAEPER